MQHSKFTGQLEYIHISPQEIALCKTIFNNLLIKGDGNTTQGWSFKMNLQGKVKMKWRQSILWSNEERTSSHNSPFVDGPSRCQCGIWVVAAPCSKENTQECLQKWRTKHAFLHCKRNQDAEFWARLTPHAEQDTTESIFTCFPQIIAWKIFHGIHRTRL